MNAIDYQRILGIAQAASARCDAALVFAGSHFAGSHELRFLSRMARTAADQAREAAEQLCSAVAWMREHGQAVAADKLAQLAQTAANLAWTADDVAGKVAALARHSEERAVRSRDSIAIRDARIERVAAHGTDIVKVRAAIVAGALRIFESTRIETHTPAGRVVGRFSQQPIELTDQERDTVADLIAHQYALEQIQLAAPTTHADASGSEMAS